MWIYKEVYIFYSASLLQSSVSHDPSEIIWFAAQENISDYQSKQLCCFISLWEPLFILFFKILWLVISKEQHLFEMSLLSLLINLMHPWWIKVFYSQIFNGNVSLFTLKIWSSTTFIIIRNVSWAAYQHIRMISEESCDTEDWSNDAEYSALHHRNKLYFTTYSNTKYLF